MPKKLTKDTFIEKSILIHGDKYDYDSVNFIDRKSKVSIICKKHGEFCQVASAHLNGRGCQICGHGREDSLNINLFKEIKDKEIAYILGMLWADGSIRSGNNLRYKNQKNYQISLAILTEDMNSIMNTMLFAGKWKVYLDKRSTRERTRLYVCYKDLYMLLMENDYYTKSIVSPNKILSKIPDELHKYFFRGYFDGDGCWYLDESGNTRNRSFIITGSNNQDWNSVEKLLTEIGVIYQLKRKSYTHGSYSRIEVHQRESIEKLGNYIYDDFLIDKIGLYRKYDKYIKIKNSYRTPSSLTPHSTELNASNVLPPA